MSTKNFSKFVKRNKVGKPAEDSKDFNPYVHGNKRPGKGYTRDDYMRGPGKRLKNHPH